MLQGLEPVKPVLLMFTPLGLAMQLSRSSRLVASAGDPGQPNSGWCERMSVAAGFQAGAKSIAIVDAAIVWHSCQLPPE